MKLNILLVVGFSLLFLTQCSNEDILNSPQEQKDFVKTTLHITLPQKSFSRTNRWAYRYNSSKGSLYNLEDIDVYIDVYLGIDIAYGPSSIIYTESEELWKHKTLEFDLRDSNPSIEVDFELLKGINYSFVVTAYSYVYNPRIPQFYTMHPSFNSKNNPPYRGFDIEQTSKELYFLYDPYLQMIKQECEDLFYGYTLWEGQESTHPTVKLTRPLTKVRYVLTDTPPGYDPGGDIDNPDIPIVTYCFSFDKIYQEWSLLEDSMIKPNEKPSQLQTIDYRYILYDSSLSKDEILLFTAYLLLPDCEVPEAKWWTDPNLGSSYTFPSFSLKRKTDSKGNTITSLANKLVTIKQSAVARGKFRVEVEDIFD